MKNSYFAVVLMASCLFAAWAMLACGGAPNQLTTQSCLPFNTPSTGSAFASVVDPLVASEMKSQNLVGAAVGVAKNGIILYAQGYGLADLSACRAVQPSTEFQIGSVTKQFTAAAILQLQNAGKLSIDTPVSTYLPAYAFDSRITLRMLLTQTSGLQDYLNFPDANSWIGGVSEPTILAQIAQASLMFTPGAYYAYSNSNYFVLGSVIEAVSAMSYANYLTSNVFKPAGLANTSYLQPSGSAAPYFQSQKPGIIPDPSLFFSAGALWSNVQDLALWDAALLNGKVIPPTLFSVMITPSGVPNFQQAGSSNYAMGWVVDTAVGHPFIWHNGETYSYTSFNGTFLDDGFAVVILTNVPVSEDTPLLGLEEQLIQAICSSPATSGSC